jgi:hypothetical protein
MSPDTRSPLSAQSMHDVWVRRDPDGWRVFERDVRGQISFGGPFPTRAYARQVAEGARMMAARLAARKGTP